MDWQEVLLIALAAAFVVFAIIGARWRRWRRFRVGFFVERDYDEEGPTGE